MKFKSVPSTWLAMAEVLDIMLYHAFGALCDYMDRHGINNPRSPEYWVCELIDELTDDVRCSKHYFISSRAKSKLLEQVYSVSRFAAEHNGQPFDAVDVHYEMYAAWLTKLEDLGSDRYDYGSDPTANWYSFMNDEVAYCRTQPVLKHKSNQRSGLIYQNI